MYNNLGISILIAFVVANVHDGTRVQAMSSVPLTQPQQELITGVYKQEHWRNPWFTLVKDGEDWTDVDRLVDSNSELDAWNKLRLIPHMMGCMYGAKFYWFLYLAVNVIGECNEMSQQRNADSDDCFNQFTEGLQKGLDTMEDVMRSLLYTRSTIGENNVDEFYPIISAIRNTLRPDGLGHAQLMEDHFVTLNTFVTSHCQPAAYPQLRIAELMTGVEQQFPEAERYDFYVHLIKYYMEEVSFHLFKIGFRYDAGTGQTTFINPP